jgi:threonine dehydratase
VTPLGGGGLLAGTALTVSALRPGAAIYGVEPKSGNDGQQSFRAGRIVKIDVPRTIADGAQTQALAPLTFGIIREHVTDIWTASDHDLRGAIRVIASTMKQIVEPTGVLGFAAAVNQRESLRGKRVGIVLSGGNIDPALLSEILA